MGYKEQAAILGDNGLQQRVMMSCYKIAGYINTETQDPSKGYRYRMASDTVVNVGGAHAQQMVTFLVTSATLQDKVTAAAASVPYNTDNITDDDIDAAVTASWDAVAQAAYGG